MSDECQECSRLQRAWDKCEVEIEKRDAEIVKLKKVSDMKSAIVEGMRRVCAIARMVNNQRPDVRMTAAFESYDISKLNNSHRAEIEKRDKLLKQTEEYIQMFVGRLGSDQEHQAYFPDDLKKARDLIKEIEDLRK